MRFSVGYELTEPARAAILQVLENPRIAALDQDESAPNNSEVAGMTDLVDLFAGRRPEG